MVGFASRAGRGHLQRFRYMNTTEIAGIQGALMLQPERHEDERGWFMELVREPELGSNFVQSNHSYSRKGTLRGLHWHKRQSDLWYVVAGEAQAVLVDLRTRADKVSSAEVILDASVPQLLFIPPGVAHGYLALTDLDVIYWVTHLYDSGDEHGLAWDAPGLGVAWQSDTPLLSDRDKNNPGLDWDLIDPSL